MLQKENELNYVGTWLSVTMVMHPSKMTKGSMHYDRFHHKHITPLLTLSFLSHILCLFFFALTSVCMPT